MLTFVISDGIIYGSNAAPGLANIANEYGYAAFGNAHAAYTGRFDAEVVPPGREFLPTGVLDSTDDTIHVVNGSRQ